MIRLFEYRVYPKTEEPIPFCWKVLFVLFMLGTLLAMAAVCSSCQPEEEDMEAVDMKEGLPATIRLEVQGEEQANFVTRTVNESVISDLHILVYNLSLIHIFNKGFFSNSRFYLKKESIGILEINKTSDEI